MAIKSKRTAKIEKRKTSRMSASKRASEHKGGSRYLKLMDEARLASIKKVDEDVIADVVPYRCSKNCKKFLGNENAPGDLKFERTVWVHGYCIGPQRDSCVCAAKTFGKPCYPCEWINNHPLPMEATEEQKTERGKLYAKERNIWNLRVAGEEEKGCQILDQSVKTFGETIFGKIKAAEGKKHKSAKDKKRWEQLDGFADPEDGMSLRITPKSKPMGKGQNFVSLESVEFTEREEEVGDEWVDKAWCLDDMIEIPEYKEIKDKFLAGGKEEDEDSDEDDQDSDDLPEAPCEKGDVIEFKHKGKKGKGKVLKVDEEEALLTVKTKTGVIKIDFDDMIQDEEEEDDEEDQDSDDDDEDDEEDDEQNDEEEGDDEDDEEDIPEVKKGSKVRWVSKKSGRTLTGTVTSKPKNSECLVDYHPTKPAIVVDVDILEVIEDDEDDEDMEKKITTLRADKKKSGKVPPKKKRKVIRDEDDDAF